MFAIYNIMVRIRKAYQHYHSAISNSWQMPNKCVGPEALL